MKPTAAILCALAILLPALAAGADDALGRKLARIDDLRNGKIDIEEAERRGRALLEEYPAPADQARIYFQLAHSCGQSSIRRYSENVLKYAGQALELDHDPLDRTWLHMYVGDATFIRSEIGDFATRRRKAARAYLEGMKETIEIHALDEPLPLPDMASIWNSFGNDPETIAWRRKRAEDMELRTKLQFVNEIIARRKIFEGQLIQIYARPPSDTAEFKRLARETIDDPPRIDRIAAAIAAEFKKSGHLYANPPDRPGRAASAIPGN